MGVPATSEEQRSVEELEVKLEVVSATLKDYERTVAAIHAIVDLHTNKHPPPPRKTAEEFHAQFDPLVEAGTAMREWFVDNWPLVMKMVARIDIAGMTSEFKDLKITDPSGRLVELDKALHRARGNPIFVRGRKE